MRFSSTGLIFFEGYSCFCMFTTSALFSTINGSFCSMASDTLPLSQSTSKTYFTNLYQNACHLCEGVLIQTVLIHIIFHFNKSYQIVATNIWIKPYWDYYCYKRMWITLWNNRFHYRLIFLTLPNHKEPLTAPRAHHPGDRSLQGRCLQQGQKAMDFYEPNK